MEAGEVDARRRRALEIWIEVRGRRYERERERYDREIVGGGLRVDKVWVGCGWLRGERVVWVGCASVVDDAAMSSIRGSIRVFCFLFVVYVFKTDDKELPLSSVRKSSLCFFTDGKVISMPSIKKCRRQSMSLPFFLDGKVGLCHL